MKIIDALFFCLLITVGIGGAVMPTAAVQAADAEPRISLAIKDKPLGEVLETLTGDTGYHFKLNSQWQDYPVSASITNLPLEQGLKRLLRSLNHTIIWESDRTVRIMVYGKVENANTGGAVSFAAPPQDEVREAEAPAESETAPPEDGAGAEFGTREPGPAAEPAGGGAEIGGKQPPANPPQEATEENAPEAPATE